MIQQSFRQQVDQVTAMLQPGFDWEKYQEEHEDGESADTLFQACVQAGMPEGEENKNYYECGSFKVKETPAALYRLLYLLKPKSIDFSSMYKTSLFGFFSADKRFLVTVELFKYEVGLYLYCPREALAGRGHFAQGGWPGADNGWSCSDEDGKAFFEMVKLAVNSTWQVYPGNNFEV